MCSQPGSDCLNHIVPFPRTTNLPLRPPAQPTGRHTASGCCVPTRRAVPSPGKGDTTVASTASWSTMTSIRCSSRPLNALWIADNSAITHTPTCLPADLCGSTLQEKTPCFQHPSPRARCSRVAIHVKWAATSASAREWEWEEQASTQPHTKWWWVGSGRSTGGQGCQCRRRQGAR